MESESFKSYQYPSLVVNLPQVARSQKNPRTTSKELQGLLAWVKVSVHYSTIWMRLCKNNTCGRVARWKPLLTPTETQRLISHLPTMSWWSPWLLGKLRENVEHFGKFVFHYIWCEKDVMVSRKWTSGKRTWWWLGDYLGLLGASGSGRLAVTEGTIDSNLYHKILKQ